jgi:hypothetical protein
MVSLFPPQFTLSAAPPGNTEASRVGAHLTLTWSYVRLAHCVITRHHQAAMGGWSARAGRAFGLAPVVPSRACHCPLGLWLAGNVFPIAGYTNTPIFDLEGSILRHA